MKRFEVWGQEKLAFDELPTVCDMLLRADTGLLADALMPLLTSAAVSECDEPPTIGEAMGFAEEVVRNLLATPYAPASEEWVVIPSTTVREDLVHEGTYRAGTEAVLVCRDDLLSYARYLDGGMERATYADSCELPPSGWDFEMSPWEEILGYRVYVPARMCERELYQFVADVIEGATFFGAEREDADERRRDLISQLEEAVAEVEEARAAGRLDELVDARDLEALGIVDDRPSEEREYDGRLADLYRRLVDVTRLELWRDCVELAGRLV